MTSPRLTAVAALLASALAFAGPPPLEIKARAGCYMLSTTAAALDADARKRLGDECQACVPSSAKEGEQPTFTIELDGKKKGTGACAVKKVAVLPTRMQMPGNGADFRCAGLFPGSECQSCVSAQGAWVAWSDGRAECSKKPTGDAIKKGLDCVWAGRQLRACSDCTFEKKSWNLAEQSCR